MAGRDRIIDAITRDYVKDENGECTTTRTAATSLFHAVRQKKGQWVGDPDGGSEFADLSRAKNTLQSPRVIRDIFTRAARRLLEAGRIGEAEFEQIRKSDRIDSNITVLDLQSGEKIQLLDLLPFVP